jgi:KipI family sensor histidine kinase inhibitor
VRILPSGSAGLLLECADLEEVVSLHAALRAEPPEGVVAMVPAARTVLLVLDRATTTPERVRSVLTGLRPGTAGAAGPPGHTVLEVPVVYDGQDLAEVAEILGCSTGEVVRRHTGTVWTVAFCGFAPGFGYLTDGTGSWDVPRRSTPRTTVPAGAVALAGEFSGVYPRESPGGWQLIGRTPLQVFDLDRDPPALLAPQARVRFVVADP